MNSLDTSRAARIAEAARILAESGSLEAQGFLHVLDQTAVACITQMGDLLPSGWLDRLYPERAKPTTEAEYEEAANRA